MKNARRLAMMGLLLCGVLALVPNSWAQQRAPILEKIAKTYGVDSWDQIQAIRYTWNGEITGLFKAARKWEWEPKTGKVSFEGKDKDGKPVKVTYMRSEINSQTTRKKQTDAGFINDNYWLLFPLHAYWDTSATVTDEGMKKLPAGAGSANAGLGEIWRGTRRLHARRHLGPLCRQRQPRRVPCLPPRRGQKAKPRHCNLDRLQKGWSAAYLNRAPRHRGRKASAHLHFGRGRQADGIRHLGGREISARGLYRGDLLR